MSADLSKVPLIARREIEARIVAPLIEAFGAELGREKALAQLERVIAQLALASGQEMARQVTENTIAALDTVVRFWGYDSAMEVERLAQNNQRYDFNVRRCRYAEMYRELGLADLGLVLSCQRDFAFFEGFNPRIKLTRTQTIMQGADHCDFRFSLRGEDE
ncbi:MAG: L-2-amino-thiazoline-4-carboxylic acid hydrolase [Desulfarculus sp.]|nr:L-2-amino-thiazoline-4-carboxylic acid hydrolase [Desulfarculus sp.]